MTEDIHNKVIENSLLFFVLRDSLPWNTGKFEGDYTMEDFHRDKDSIINQIRQRLDAMEMSIEEMVAEKEKEDDRLFRSFVLYFLQADMKEILKKDYHRYFRSTITKKLRDEILQRDNYTCQYCGTDLRKIEQEGFPPHVDHIKPRRSGGKHNPENLLACCWKCNSGKKDFDLFEYEDDDYEDDNS